VVPSLPSLFVRCLRQVTLGFALLAVLAMGLPLHLPTHADCEEHGHPVANLADQADQGADVPSDPDPDPEPEDCGHCSCPPPVSALALVATHPLLPARETALCRPRVGADLPESRSYPPDLPPDRLS
jgi:hypothetical protein